MWMRRLLGVLCLGAAAVSGCSERDPKVAPITASDASALGRWRIKASGDFTREEWREFEAALQEIRFGIMAERAATGSSAIEAALHRRIDGKTFREVLILANESKLARLGPLRDEMLRAREGNALLVTKPGDGSSARYLAELRDRQETRLKATLAEIDAARKRLAELGVERPKDLAADELQDVELSRDAAWAEIGQLMDDHRGMALSRYGDHPARVDRDGVRLTGAERDEFLARREVAAAQGRVVLPVWLKDRWWMYEGLAQAPTFSRAVMAHLTAADRRAIEEQWTALEAEIWARRSAFREEREAAAAR
jgi:hypothetical protein